MDKRNHVRIPLGTQCRAQFRIGDRCYRGIPVANLGPAGCCIHIPAQVAVEVKEQALVQDLELQHPSLPPGIIEARVAWIYSRGSAWTGFVETGVEFLDLPSVCAQGILSFMESHADCERRSSQWDGLPS